YFYSFSNLPSPQRSFDVLRQSGSLCDAIISVQSQTFRAHRLVLACASRALAQHLAKGDADSPAHCTLEYFSPHTFQQVLDFIYTQALEVPVKDLQQLLRAAQVLEMQLLEDQCRKQLDRLEAREKDKNGEAVDLTEEEKSVEEKNQKQKSRPVSESKVQKTSSPVEKPSFGIVMESASIADSADVPANQQSPKRKAKLSPISATLCNRDSVITRPNSSDFCLWHRCLICTVPSAGLKQTKYASRSYPEVPKVRERADGCQHCSSRLLCDPLLRESASTQLGKDVIKQKCLNAATRTAPRDRQNCDGCQFCGRDAVQHAANARDHRGEKPYQCKHCPKKFSLKHQLDTHHRVHTGEKPFECRLCGQRSRDYSAMIKHLRTHGGAAPYQCTVCLEFCSSLVAMQRHIKSHAVQDFPPDWSINNTYLYISHI
uniref:Zinc finger and BTB domain containing 32 n=1 Tax=Poecilia latipinna TaxID=48699 RepID=A0A3B3V804_9TELE